MSRVSLPPSRPLWTRSVLIGVFHAVQVLLCAAAGAGVVCCVSTAQERAKVTAVEAKLCAARADYKVAAVLAGGRLEPTPGSARAAIEAAEDAFCLALQDAGP